MIRCHVCVSDWVDRAVELSGVLLTDLVRRRLIASLLSRPHLILAGALGIGKTGLARALAGSGVGGQQDRVCWLQGHPWWAANTRDVSRFVELQTDYSLSRLAQFASTESGGSPRARSMTTQPHHAARWHEKPSRANRESMRVCGKTVCVERMSPVEVELYFKIVAGWLAHNATGKPEALAIRLIGTYDSAVPLKLDEHTNQLVAQVHLDRARGYRVDRRGARHGPSQNRLLTCL